MSNNAIRILVVEDDTQQRELLVGILEKAEFSVHAADSCEAAIVLLKQVQVEVVFADWKLPNLTGIDLLNYIRKNQPHLGVVIATAHGTISHAVEAMQSGADDYLAKPFQRQELLLAIEKAHRAYSLRSKNKTLREALSSEQQLTDLVGVSEALKNVKTRMAKVAATDATVLVSGESGTGKELVARGIHRLSNRAQHRFVAINCGAIPSDIAEAELFGAKKGAYTGAIADKQGKLAYADNGTLFLDEIGELPLLLQAKLLRFLQEGTITALGDNNEQKLNVRIIAASHKDLSDMVKNNTFREDLYYRLNILPIHIPPLRERPEDIGLLAAFFLQQKSAQYGLTYEPLNESLIAKLAGYEWPGNVRELSNRIERFAVLKDEQELIPIDYISASDEHFTLPNDGIKLDELEQSLIAQALEKTNGNKTQAAKLLGLNYKAFLYRLEKHK